MTTTQLDFAVEREVLIRAPRPTVFRFFTDSDRFAKWWGPGSTIDGRPGGAVRIVHPGGIVNVGEVLEIDADERVVFSYGFESGKPIPAGGSRVTVTLADHARGTLLKLRHEMDDAKTRDHFVQGWRFQLALFANVAAAEAHGDIAALADRWLAAWNENDPDARRRAFAAIATDDVAFADRYSCTVGVDDLNAHVSAGKVHLPGMTLSPTGGVAYCQGLALAPWQAASADGTVVGTGTNAFELAPDGRIERVVGFWSGPTG